jgi:hypothetical protein
LRKDTYTLCCHVCGDRVFETEDAGSWEATKQKVPDLFQCKCGFVSTAKGRQQLLDCLQDMLSIDNDSWVDHDGISHPTRRRDPDKYPPVQSRLVFLRPGKGPPTA